VVAQVVDDIPRRLWRPLNLYLGGRLHFCVGDGVRTVEWNGRVLASGRLPFPFEWYETEQLRLETELDDA
jgi:hypothetical protein